MKKAIIIFSVMVIAITACKNSDKPIKEPWIEKPVSEWPAFALTNEISFTDTTFHDIANSFLINTGTDTFGISCKHIFMAFENRCGYSSICFEPDFKYWNMYPKNDKENITSVKSLINSDENEVIGQFNTLKIRDWLLFELENKNIGIYPLKIRYTPVQKNEVVYAVGWGQHQKDNSNPALLKLQCFKNVGEYYYTKNLTTNIKTNERSGSPVIDKNGYLVGIVSGQEGKLGVIGSVEYLKTIFDKYGIRYY